MIANGAPHLPRLRQVALAAGHLEPVVAQLQEMFPGCDPFHDPGVGDFGLENAVFAVGDTFVEVVAPVRPGTTAGRYLEKRGGDSGYMAIFQVADVRAARRRVADAGIRVVWEADLDDIAGTHLHPKDVPGAIVSVDWADPPESWRWAGPDWVGGAPRGQRGGIQGITVEVDDPAEAAGKWSVAIGAEPSNGPEGPAIRLAHAGQEIRFLPLASSGEGGIVEVALRGAGRPGVEIAGVRFGWEETE